MYIQSQCGVALVHVYVGLSVSLSLSLYVCVCVCVRENPDWLLSTFLSHKAWAFAPNLGLTV